jgi:polyketide biosynthesis 3-hydroxy-3-methylglutaryl-CoA synthase-like enzyme PksG
MSQAAQRSRAIGAQLNERHRLTLAEYEQLLLDSRALRFGTRDLQLHDHCSRGAQLAPGKHRLLLQEIREFHRQYVWTS